jgi:hypothetical protein
VLAAVRALALRRAVSQGIGRSFEIKNRGPRARRERRLWPRCAPGEGGRGGQTGSPPRSGQHKVREDGTGIRPIGLGDGAGVGADWREAEGGRGARSAVPGAAMDGAGVLRRRRRRLRQRPQVRAGGGACGSRSGSGGSECGGLAGDGGGGPEPWSPGGAVRRKGTWHSLIAHKRSGRGASAGARRRGCGAGAEVNLRSRVSGMGLEQA